MFRRRIPLVYRFFGKFTQPNVTDCWLWQGAPNSAGYGTIREGGRNGKSYLAHRVAYQIYSQQGIPKGLCVCHTCDTPLCVNPKHLFLGTNSDNVADRKSKGRCGAHGKPGMGCGHAKLTDRQVHMIRKDDRPHHLIAKDFRVARTTVVNIKKRRTWKHI